MATTAINIRRVFHGSASRSAIIAVSIGLASTSWMSALLIGRHLILLVRGFNQLSKAY
jgi:hypothetical protein